MIFASVLRTGGVYRAEWVERLNRQAQQHLRVTRLVCLTDAGPIEGCETVAFAHNWPGWWSKIELFRPGLFGDEVVFYLDLDSLVLRFFAIPETMRGLWMLDDFFTPARPASGAMIWRPSRETEAIYSDFARDAARLMREVKHGDGGWIGRHEHSRLQLAFPGIFRSYKAHKLQYGPGRCSVVCFHGRPKQNELGGWVQQAWIGKPGQQ